MRVRRLLVAVLLALTAAVCWLGGTLPATAGGPTSVLLANPDAQRVKAYYYTDAGYQRLTESLEEASGAQERPASVPDEFGATVRLTWLIHDLLIWRIDRVYVTSTDGLWVATQVDADDTGVATKPVRWHRAADEGTLRSTLSAAGLLGQSADPTDDSSAHTSSASPTPDRSVVAQAPAGGSGGGSGGLALGLGSGAIGVAVGVGGVLLFRRVQVRAASVDPKFQLDG